MARRRMFVAAATRRRTVDRARRLESSAAPSHNPSDTFITSLWHDVKHANQENGGAECRFASRTGSADRRGGEDPGRAGLRRADGPADGRSGRHLDHGRLHALRQHGCRHPGGPADLDPEPLQGPATGPAYRRPGGRRFHARPYLPGTGAAPPVHLRGGRQQGPAHRSGRGDRRGGQSPAAWPHLDHSGRRRAAVHRERPVPGPGFRTLRLRQLEHGARLRLPRTLLPDPGHEGSGSSVRDRAAEPRHRRGRHPERAAASVAASKEDYASWDLLPPDDDVAT